VDESSPFAALGAVAMLATVVLCLYLLVLGVLAPLFWYGTNRRTKETSEKLDRTNKLLTEILKSLSSGRRE
jgi:ABC-type Fe3+ transport system permease subunit